MSTTTMSDNDDEGLTDTGLIVLIAGVAVFVAILVGLIIWCLCCKGGCPCGKKDSRRKPRPGAQERQYSVTLAGISPTWESTDDAPNESSAQTNGTMTFKTSENEEQTAYEELNENYLKEPERTRQVSTFTPTAIRKTTANEVTSAAGKEAEEQVNGSPISQESAGNVSASPVADVVYSMAQGIDTPPVSKKEVLPVETNNNENTTVVVDVETKHSENGIDGEEDEGQQNSFFVLEKESPVDDDCVVEMHNVSVSPTVVDNVEESVGDRDEQTDNDENLPSIMVNSETDSTHEEVVENGEPEQSSDNDEYFQLEDSQDSSKEEEVVNDKDKDSISGSQAYFDLQEEVDVAPVPTIRKSVSFRDPNQDDVHSQQSFETFRSSDDDGAFNELDNIVQGQEPDQPSTEPATTSTDEAQSATD